MSYSVAMERQPHLRRVEQLQRRLEKLEKDYADTEIQLANEKLIADSLAEKTRRSGLLAMIDDGEDEFTVVDSQEGEMSGERSDVAEVEATPA
jgi:cell division protein FtsB